VSSRRKRVAYRDLQSKISSRPSSNRPAARQQLEAPSAVVRIIHTRDRNVERHIVISQPLRTAVCRRRRENGGPGGCLGNSESVGIFDSEVESPVGVVARAAGGRVRVQAKPLLVDTDEGKRGKEVVRGDLP